MRGRDLAALAALAALGLVLASDNGPAGGALPELDLGGGNVLEIWTLSTQGGQRCGVPLLPRGTDNYGADVVPLPPGSRCWGWTPPGDLRAAERFGVGLVADLELRAATKAAPLAGWTGAELAEAEQLAALVGGVTSHGYVAPALRQVLQRFAAAGRTAYPQVYDSDRSTEPRGFLRTCVNSYRKAGFANIVPLLSASSGVDYLLAWIEECAELGVRPAIYSLERMQEKGIDCGVLA